MRWSPSRSLTLSLVLLAPALVQAQTDPDPTKSLPAPTSMTLQRGQVGKSFRFTITANAQAGTVWGSDIYTDDSALAAAVVHAGLLKSGETGTVKVTVVEGKNAYEGTLRNGVQSNNYNAWGGSYKFEGKAQVRVRAAKENGEDNPLPDPGHLTAYREKVGKVLYIQVVGNKNAGIVWGTDIYTDDTTLAQAAVHSGVVKDGEKKVVKVTITGAQEAFKGSSRNEVQSSDYGSWQGSYKIEAVKEAKAKDAPKE